MNVKDVRGALLELTKYYFGNATVIFGRQRRIAKQGKPLVTICTGAISRSLNPSVEIIDGRPVSFYPSAVPVQIDLFTAGRKIDAAKGCTPIMENTAADDMTEFVNFLSSDLAVQYCHRRDIAIVPNGTVQDLTGLINDTGYEYRAMIELMVYFTATAIGYSGTLAESSIAASEDGYILTPTIEETSSGGGNAGVLADEMDYFTNVEINERLMKEETK